MRTIAQYSLLIAVAALVNGQISMPTYAGVRGKAHTSVSRGANKNVNVNRNTNKNVNINSRRDVDIDVDVDVDHRGGYGYGCCYHSHSVGTAVAVVATAAIVGSMVNTLPYGCSTVIVNGFAYQQCGSAWYQPQISGSTTTYIVVNAPR